VQHFNPSPSGLKKPHKVRSDLNLFHFTEQSAQAILPHMLRSKKIGGALKISLTSGGETTSVFSE